MGWLNVVLVDGCAVGGVGLIGYGLWLLSAPCAIIYAGAVLIIIARHAK